MQYADQQVVSFTPDPTDRLVEFTTTGAEPADTWIVPLIGWAVISQPYDAEGCAHTSLEPVVLQDEQLPVPVSRILATRAAGVTFRIRHRT
ncbi:MAG: hypothetical protein ABIQ59_18290 [Nocardioidaceae bacterium]